MDDSRFDALPQEWRAALEDFLAGMESISGSTKSRQRYSDVLGLFVEKQLAGRNLADTTRADCRAFVNAPAYGGYRRGQPVSVACKNSRLSALNSLFKFASTYEIGDGQVLWQKPLPTAGLKYLKPVRAPRYMSPAQLGAFFNAIDVSSTRGKRDYCFFLWLLLTARRIGEITRLRFADLEYTSIMDGEHSHLAWCFHFRGKGRSRIDDSQELPEVVKLALDAYLLAAGRMDALEQHADEPIFGAVYVGQGRHDYTRVPLTHAQLGEIFKEYLRKAGLPLTHSPHVLRHSSAKLRRASGEPIESIKEILRHSNISTTWVYLESLNTSADRHQAKLQAQLPFLAGGK